MSWKQLLAQRKVQLHRTSNEELDQLRALIARDLNDAALTPLSADRRARYVNVPQPRLRLDFIKAVSRKRPLGADSFNTFVVQE
jgi:hypothetical protein